MRHILCCLILSWTIGPPRSVLCTLTGSSSLDFQARSFTTPDSLEPFSWRWQALNLGPSVCYTEAQPLSLAPFYPFRSTCRLTFLLQIQDCIYSEVFGNVNMVWLQTYSDWLHVFSLYSCQFSHFPPRCFPLWNIRLYGFFSSVKRHALWLCYINK